MEISIGGSRARLGEKRACRESRARKSHAMAGTEGRPVRLEGVESTLELWSKTRLNRLSEIRKQVRDYSTGEAMHPEVYFPPVTGLSNTKLSWSALAC